MKKIVSVILAILTMTSTLFATSVFASVAQTSITKITSTKSSIKVKWEPIDDADGYQIQKSTNKSFKKNSKKYNISNTDFTSKTIKKLKSNKNYYVRIRAYKLKSETKTYSKWSNTKSIKTKKNNSSTSNNKNNTASSTKPSSSNNNEPSTPNCANGNHSMPTGNSGKWFNNRNECKEYMSQVWDMWSQKRKNGEITYEEYVKKCPYGYECWSCSYCGKWTVNFYYD